MYAPTGGPNTNGAQVLNEGPGATGPPLAAALA